MQQATSICVHIRDAKGVMVEMVQFNTRFCGFHGCAMQVPVQSFAVWYALSIATQYGINARARGAAREGDCVSLPDLFASAQAHCTGA